MRHCVDGHECIFGIKSYIAKKSDDEIIIHATECLWKDKKNWTPAVCTSIEQYDIGLVKGINKDDYCCTKRRSKGDNICEVILKKEHYIPAKPIIVQSLDVQLGDTNRIHLDFSKA